MCPPCEEPCGYRCEHSKCPKKCGVPCVPCNVCSVTDSSHFHRNFLSVAIVFWVYRSLADGNVSIRVVPRDAERYAIENRALKLVHYFWNADMRASDSAENLVHQNVANVTKK